jgi:hypothetical protein
MDLYVQNETNHEDTQTSYKGYYNTAPVRLNDTYEYYR